MKPDIFSAPRKNTGELPSYYIAEDHEPIVSEETFRTVAEELERRAGADGKAHGGSVFSGRIVCEECGGFYGRKVWHSGSDYVTWRWHCNNRFAKRTGCTTPTVKEEDLAAAFIRMFNGLYARRREIEENWRVCLDAVTDTSALEKELDRIGRTCGELQTLMKNALVESGKAADATEANGRYRDYESRLLEKAAVMVELEEKIAALSSKRVRAEQYLKALTGRNGPMTEFEPLAWQAVVDHATIGTDGKITFFLRDGSKAAETVKSGVRPYRRQTANAAEARA